MRTPENAEASMADINTVLLRSAVVVAIASLSFGGPFARRRAYDIPVERLKAMEAHFAAWSGESDQLAVEWPRFTARACSDGGRFVWTRWI